MKAQRKLTTCDKSSELPDAFADFFTEKIPKIRIGLESRKAGVVNQFSDCAAPMVTLCEFDPVTSQKLLDIICGTTVKTCQLNPLPATVLKQCLDIPLPALTKIVNLSIGQGIMPTCMKEALLDPLLKQSSLDHELFPNYRPISNLIFTSKSCERVVALPVNNYLHDNELVIIFGIYTRCQ